jgi:hypothetical protein
VALQAPGRPGEAGRHFQDVLGAALQMEALVSTLLTLGPLRGRAAAGGA